MVRDTDVAHPLHGLYSAGDIQLRDDGMTGDGVLDAQLRSLLVSRFAHIDNIRVGAHHTSQCAGIRHSGAVIDSGLRDALYLVFNEVFHGQDIEMSHAT